MVREPGSDDDDLEPATELIEALKELDRKREGKNESGDTGNPSDDNGMHAAGLLAENPRGDVLRP